MDYYANGTYSENPTESCVEKANSCPCGSGQLQCSVTDALTNSPYSWCQPSQIDGVSNPCPVICTASQEMCMVDNYNTNGVLTDFTESCITTGSTCQCGKSATRCRMGPGNSWCQPTWSVVENKRSTCPLYCDPTTQQMCSVPNYDSFGTFQKFTQFCGDTETTCDCTKGSGAKLCNLTATFSECIGHTAFAHRTERGVHLDHLAAPARHGHALASGSRARSRSRSRSRSEGRAITINRLRE